MNKIIGKNEHDKISDEDKKWIFEDYAYIVAVVLFIASRLIPSRLGLEDMIYNYELNSLLSSSWIIFIFTALVVAIKDLYDGRNNTDGTRKKLVKDVLYIAIIVALLLRGILTGAWDSSWLAGPITWILFMVLWIISGNMAKKAKKGVKQILQDVGLVSIFVLGIIAEVLTQAWIAFPITWIVISAIEGIGLIRQGNHTEDDIYDILYHIFTIILISMGLIWDMWITSWLAMPVVIILSKVISFIKSRYIRGTK